MSLRLPKGAEPIHSARLSGKKPSELVLISTIGGLPNEVNPVVVVPVGERPVDFDWRWSLGLQTVVIFGQESKVTAKGVTRCLLDQKQNGFRETYLWDADRQRGWVAMEGMTDHAIFNMTVGERRAFEGLGR